MRRPLLASRGPRRAPAARPLRRRTAHSGEAPDNAFIGSIERSFDLLGCRFSPAGLTLAKKSIDIFINPMNLENRLGDI